MSQQRLTADAFARAVDKATSGGSAFELVREAERARSEEARLLEESRKKDEAIKALADALHGALKDIRGRMGHRLLTHDGEWCACDDCAHRLAALRLAGRTP